ncbi:MAG: tail fiber protein [Gilvibacter sp.]
MAIANNVGEIILVAFNFAPSGWKFCEGQELSKDTFPKLYDKIGTTFDPNREKFLLPDLRGKAPVGVGNEYDVGMAYGNEEFTMTINSMPVHDHGPMFFNVSDDSSENSVPQSGDSMGVIGAKSGRTFKAINAYTSTGTPSVQLHSSSISSKEVGAGEPLNVMQPYLAMRYIIRVV